MRGIAVEVRLSSPKRVPGKKTVKELRAVSVEYLFLYNSRDRIIVP
jgi:hypothetical protein